MDKKNITEEWITYCYLSTESVCGFLACHTVDFLLNSRIYLVGCILNKPARKTKRNNSRRQDPGNTTVLVFRFRGYPTKEQEHFLNQNIGNCRFLWNRMKKDYDKTGRFLTPAQYKKQEGLEFLKIGDALALANVQLNFEAAKSDYESGRRGRPKSKNKHRCKASYKTNAVYHGGVSNLNIDKNLLQLPKLDSKVKLRVHREIPSGGTLKNCTVTHEPNGAWMFSLSYEYRKKEAPVRAFEKETVRHIGLDMSVPKLYIDSMGNEADFYKTYRKVEKRIAIENRRLSRMQYGSSNYEKQCKKIAKLYAKAKHQRRDMLHKLSCMLTDQYDLITVEDLDMAAMKKALKLGKSISDNGWGEFLVMLKYKSDRKGSLILQVDKWFPSSKTCLACGYVHKELTLKDRTYVCPACGHAMNRDHQAAVNIDQEGLRILHYYITEDQEVAAMNPTLLEKSTKAA